MENNTCRMWAEEVFEGIRAKMPAMIRAAEKESFLPYTVEQKRMAPGPFDGICWWTNGFWPGMMWRMFEATGEEIYRTEARRAENLLQQAFADFEHLHHDVGFMWRISTGFDAELTGREEAKRQTLYAANLLAGRFNPNGFIRAWNEDKAGWAIIDCMMNLSLLYWASEQTGDPRFRLIARRHAEGTSEHIVIFDPATGEVLEKPAGQGYESGSAWSRGQAWAIYGFAISYRHTGEKAFLDTSLRVAERFLQLLSGDWLPVCDFLAPETPVIRDDCAGGIAACGMLTLAECLEELGEDGGKWRDAAFHLLRALAENHLNLSPDFPALLTHCTGAYHSADHEIPMVYGDFYFVEGLCRLMGRKGLAW